MYNTRTIQRLQYLILMESLFCINRSYLIEDKRIKFLCNLFFVCSLIFIICAVTYDLAIDDTPVHIGTRVFQLFVILEALFHAATAHRRKSLDAITSLDEKCRIDDDFACENVKVTKTSSVLIILSTFIDYMGTVFLMIKPSVMMVICVAIGAHDAEMKFYTSIVEVVNERLERVTRVELNLALKMYRHVLVTTAHLNEEFNSRILLLFSSILISTVIYAIILMLAESNTLLNVALYLIWRELKLLIPLWRLCHAAAKTETICKQISSTLANQLFLYKGVKTDQYMMTRRWHATMLAERPHYASGSILIVDLSVPPSLVDVSINYLLIIIQIYLAYQP